MPPWIQSPLANSFCDSRIYLINIVRVFFSPSCDKVTSVTTSGRWLGQCQPRKAAACKLLSSSVKKKKAKPFLTSAQTTTGATVCLYLLFHFSTLPRSRQSFGFSWSTCHLNILFLGTHFITGFFLNLSYLIHFTLAPQRFVKLNKFFTFYSKKWFWERLQTLRSLKNAKIHIDVFKLQIMRVSMLFTSLLTSNKQSLCNSPLCFLFQITAQMFITWSLQRSKRGKVGVILSVFLKSNIQSGLGRWVQRGGDDCHNIRRNPASLTQPWSSEEMCQPPTCAKVTTC